MQLLCQVFRPYGLKTLQHVGNYSAQCGVDCEVNHFVFRLK